MNSLPWLARFPVGLFAVPVGLFALGGAWQRASRFGWPRAGSAADLLAWTALVLLSLFLLVYVTKCLRHPSAMVAEFRHPVSGSLTALIPISVLLCTVYFGRPGHAGWLVTALLALLMMGLVSFRIVALITTAALPTAVVTPALYVAPVAGGLVGAMTLATLGYPGWAALLFGMGLASWALLEIRVLNRLYEGAMPAALRPTIGLEMAPPTVATLAASTLWPQMPGEFLIIGLGIAAGPVVAVLVRYNWWRRVPFVVGFWSFSFPVAALASGVIEVVRRGGWPPAVAGMALGVASLVIAFLLLRTLRLLMQGRLLPPPTAATAPVQP
jgi:tellurite resistance protein